MSLVLQYKFDQADLTIDSSTSNISLVNAGGVVSSVDASPNDSIFHMGHMFDHTDVHTCHSAQLCAKR